MLTHDNDDKLSAQQQQDNNSTTTATTAHDAEHSTAAVVEGGGIAESGGGESAQEQSAPPAPKGDYCSGTLANANVLYTKHQGSIFYMKIIFFPTLNSLNVYVFLTFQDMKDTKSFTKLWKNYKTSLIFMETILQID